MAAEMTPEQVYYEFKLKHETVAYCAQINFKVKDLLRQGVMNEFQMNPQMMMQMGMMKPGVRNYLQKIIHEAQTNPQMMQQGQMNPQMQENQQFGMSPNQFGT